MNVEKKNLTILRLNETGQLTIPDDYRRSHSLDSDSALVVVEIGDALVLVPYDTELSLVTDRLQESMKGSGCDIDSLIQAADQSRSEIVNQEFQPTNSRID